MNIPTITEVTNEVYSYVKDLRGWGIDEGDCRLQVYADGQWILRTGDSQYDQDHKGYWGCSGVTSKTTKAECRSIAHELIEQVKDHAAS